MTPGSLGERLPAATGVVAAALASSCCLLPLVLIVAGVTSGGLMMTMMRYEWLTLPVGAGGLVGAYALYFRAQRRCAATACRFVGQRSTRVMLGVSTVVVVIAILLKFFPSWTADLLQQLA